MRKILKLTEVAVILLMGFAAVSCGNVRKLSQHTLFEADAADSIPYRIPTIATMHNGDLLALADYRHCLLDIGWGRVDIHSRTSGDRGKTWSDKAVLIEGTGVSKATDCGFGDAAIVADRESGDVLVVMVCGETVYWHQTTTRQNPNRVAVIRSHDNGRTWSQWEEITEQVYSLFDDCRHGCIQSCFVASGKIFQSRTVKTGSHYRIYAALCARPNGNRVIYSDDFGRTWHALGGPDSLPAPSGDEPKCEELPDGSVILSARAKGGRIFNIYRYSDVSSGTGQWGTAAFSGAENDGCTAVSNACNGEIIIVPAIRKEDGKKVRLVLQSVPLGPGRSNVGIYYKELPEDPESVTPEVLAADWEKPYQVSESTSAYSTMMQLRGGNIAFYYEEHENHNCNGGYDMVYKELTLSEITSGAYKAAR